MDDVFKDAMKQVFREAHPDLTERFKEKMIFIQGEYKHSRTTVQSCLDGMSDPPTLVELLTAAYVVNGGLLFKHCATHLEEEDSEESEYTKLMEEMEQLNCQPAPAATGGGAHSDASVEEKAP